MHSVERALDLLEVLGEHSGPMGVTELSSNTGLPAATIHRLAQTLVARGYLRQLRDRRYYLGSRLAALGSRAGAMMGSRAQPLLRELARELQETVNLATLTPDGAEYIGQSAGSHSVRMFTEVGRRVPLHSTGVGKALLSLLPDHDALRLLRPDDMVQFTPTTITTPQQMLVELATIRAHGFAMDEGEMEQGVRCIAVPFVADTYMAVSVSGPAARMTDELVERARVALDAARPQLVAMLAD
ncbi:MAG: IclR family transcriptional regulator [Salinibacterium sp.]|nr:IclR family transcriptional regulator [Salinibacterium sp.]